MARRVRKSIDVVKTEEKENIAALLLGCTTFDAAEVAVQRSLEKSVATCTRKRSERDGSQNSEMRMRCRSVAGPQEIRRDMEGERAWVAYCCRRCGRGGTRRAAPWPSPRRSPVLPRTPSLLSHLGRAARGRKKASRGRRRSGGFRLLVLCFGTVYTGGPGACAPWTVVSLCAGSGRLGAPKTRCGRERPWRFRQTTSACTVQVHGTGGPRSGGGRLQRHGGRRVYVYS